MPQQLTKEQLNNYRKIMENGGVNGAIQVYSELLTKGYNYAGWAKGVAGADTLTGNSALAYLEGSALLGINGNGSSNISVQQATNIKVGMALGYVDSLLEISDKDGGFLNRDVNYKETYAFHESVFNNNG